MYGCEKWGFPKGAASPIWHTTLPAKSSVLYLCDIWSTDRTAISDQK